MVPHNELWDGKRSYISGIGDHGKYSARNNYLFLQAGQIMESIKQVEDKMMAREARRKILRFRSVQEYREIENKPNSLYLAVAQFLLESSIN